MPKSAFTELLARFVRDFPTQKMAADALGVNLAHLNKLLNGHGRPLNIENCIRLALLMDLSPSEVLRTAGKAEAAALIDEAYGPYIKSDLTVTQRKLLHLWDGIPEQFRPDLERHLANLSSKTATSSKRRPSH